MHLLYVCTWGGRSHCTAVIGSGESSTSVFVSPLMDASSLHNLRHWTAYLTLVVRGFFLCFYWLCSIGWWQNSTGGAGQLRLPQWYHFMADNTGISLPGNSHLVLYHPIPHLTSSSSLCSSQSSILAARRTGFCETIECLWFNFILTEVTEGIFVFSYFVDEEMEFQWTRKWQSYN